MLDILYRLLDAVGKHDLPSIHAVVDSIHQHEITIIDRFAHRLLLVCFRGLSLRLAEY